MLLIDDFAIIGVFERVLSKLKFNLSFKLSDELVVYAAFNQNVVGCHAGLAAVQKFTEHDALGSKFDVCARVYDTGAFAA